MLEILYYNIAYDGRPAALKRVCLAFFLNVFLHVLKAAALLLSASSERTEVFESFYFDFCLNIALANIAYAVKIFVAWQARVDAAHALELRGRGVPAA